MVNPYIRRQSPFTEVLIPHTFFKMFTNFLSILLFIHVTQCVSLSKRDTIAFNMPSENSEHYINSNISVSFDFRRNGMIYYTFPMTTYLFDVALNTSVLVSNISEPLVGTHHFILSAPSTAGEYRLEVFTPTWHNHISQDGMWRQVIDTNKVASVTFSVYDTEKPTESSAPASTTTFTSISQTTTATSSSTVTEVTEIHSKISPTATYITETSDSSGSGRRLPSDSSMLWLLLVTLVFIF